MIIVDLRDSFKTKYINIPLIYKKCLTSRSKLSAIHQSGTL